MAPGKERARSKRSEPSMLLGVVDPLFITHETQSSLPKRSRGAEVKWTRFEWLIASVRAVESYFFSVDAAIEEIGIAQRPAPWPRGAPA